MNDKQQLAAMGEHMREVVDCKLEFKVPDGWRLVPVSPTAEMLKAAADMPLKATRGMHDSACYRVMLAAAPECKP